MMSMKKVNNKAIKTMRDIVWKHIFLLVNDFVCSSEGFFGGV